MLSYSEKLDDETKEDFETYQKALSLYQENSNPDTHYELLCAYQNIFNDLKMLRSIHRISDTEFEVLRDEVLNGTYDKDCERNDRYDKDSFCDGMTDEEKMQHHRDHMAELEQEQALDPVTLDRGDPYRNVRDDDQNGQYDYMENRDK